MTEEKTRNRSNSWKWVVIVVAGLLVLAVTCVTSLFWGGLIGYAIGRGSARQGPVEEFYDGPFDRQIPELPEMPGIPDMPFQGLRPWLGVTFQQTAEGAHVTEVISGSPAEEAGLQEGDIITAVDGRPVTLDQPLNEVIGQYAPGDRVALIVMRDGQERTVRVRLASRMEMMMPEEDFRFELPENGGG